jgi:hypothetical protein
MNRFAGLSAPGAAAVKDNIIRDPHRINGGPDIQPRWIKRAAEVIVLMS